MPKKAKKAAKKKAGKQASKKRSTELKESELDAMHGGKEQALHRLRKAYDLNPNDLS